MASNYPNNRIRNFPSPFSTYSRTLYPRTVNEMFDWAEWLWSHNGMYSQAVRKSVRYFITDLEIQGTNGHPIAHDTRRKYEDTLNLTYHIKEQLGLVGDDIIGMGNSFTSALMPISRQLTCPKCGFTSPLSLVDYSFESFKFKGVCPGCDTRVTFKRVDQLRPDNGQEVKFIRWNPRNIIIDYCPITNYAEYYLDIPDEWKSIVKKGDPVWLEQLPWEFVEAVEKNKYFKFNREYFLHLKIAPGSTMTDVMKGWGVPLFMNEFEQVVHIQILDRFNEAIVLDHLMPFRLISPPPTASGGDPVKSANLGRFMSNVKGMIAQHRKDPTSWHTVPFPVQYQALGGEGRELLQPEVLDNATTRFLSDIGIPQEFTQSSLQMNGNYVPLGLRMFERVWDNYVSDINLWLDWATNILATTLTWEPVKTTLNQSSIYEDDEIRNTKIEMAGAGVISKHTAFKAIGVDPDYERERMKEEAAMDEEDAEETAKEQDKANMLKEQMATPPPMTVESMQQMQAQQGGAAAPTGDPSMGAPAAQGAPGTPGSGAASMGQIHTIDDLMAQADQLAQQVLTMDPSSRTSFLLQLGKDNQPLHAQVKQSLEKMENQAGQQGKIMARQGQMQ